MERFKNIIYDTDISRSKMLNGSEEIKNHFYIASVLQYITAI